MAPLWLAFWLMWAGGLDAAPPRTVTLTIEASGFASDAGMARFAVYSSERGFLVDETRQSVQPISGRRSRWTITVPPGTYAAAVHHDVNNNGVMERTRIGLPTEPYGFSNDARGRLGPPAWRSAVVQVRDTPTVVSVRVR